MYKRIEISFYLLSAFVLIGVMFLIHPARIEPTAQFQQTVLTQVVSAWDEIIVGVNPIEDLKFVYTSVDKFYSDSATAAIALLTPVPTPPEAERAIDNIAFAVSELLNFAPDQIETTTLAQAEQKQELEDPIYNIIPPFEENEDVIDKLDEFIKDELLAINELWSELEKMEEGVVAGESIEKATISYDSKSMSAPVNDSDRPWVTLKDNLTGQKYCVAIYNNEVNKYLGECKYDYY